MSGAAQCPSDSLRSRSCAHGAVNKQANLQLRQLTADRTAGRAGRPELRFWDTRSDRSPADDAATRHQLAWTAHARPNRVRCPSLPAVSTLLVLDRPAPEVRHEVRGKAAPVIELIDTFDVDWRGRSALLICANGGDAARQLCAERGTAGVDVLTLHDLIGDAMSERQFGIVVVGDILYQRTATEVTTAFDWIRDHLCQGGECLVETRTFLAPDGGGLPPAMPTDYAHLVLPVR